MLSNALTQCNSIRQDGVTRISAFQRDVMRWGDVDQCPSM
jgi:hypothetical protein